MPPATVLRFDEHRPQIDPLAWVAPTATLIGQITLAAGSSVWYSAVLRGDGDAITIGEDTNIQDGCVVHTDPGFAVRVGRGVSVGHNAVLHGCVIGDGALIGMGAVVLNGADIGEGCLVAAGAVVLEGTTFEPGTLVAGVPAKGRRALEATERDALQDNAATYVRLAQRHAGAT